METAHSSNNAARGLAGQNVAVIGAGAWGTTLALHAARQGLPVRLWARRPEFAARLAEERENSAFVPGQKFPAALSVTADPAEAVEGAAVVLWVVPSHAFRSAVRLALSHADADAVHVSASKGIEDESFATMTKILDEESAGGRPLRVGVLSGPSFAHEVAQGLPTAVTLAARDQADGLRVQSLLSAPVFRIYTSGDVLGVELGGALKNVYAVAAGICDGLNLGLNARAALITRALAEMIRLAKVLGANPMTLSGLSGAGDLILTATGELSRNRRVGLRLGAGESLEAILAGRREVAEGVKNAKSVWGLARSLEVSAPMAREVYRVLYEGKQPRQGMVDLLTRRLKNELPPDLDGGVEP
ncbi:MAG: NAD(P)-dependent glycerol-3-phosphate dehydrogenase [Deltaproteobacteria bacterium]|jgi:glycerol-3-phosphate dehydrogenase (NAD(P)+)|nr:NAD(P)-dependent glycerol-3-phosphate dehydrogenase [Deltaproteobacteria bacterium]